MLALLWQALCLLDWPRRMQRGPGLPNTPAPGETTPPVTDGTGEPSAEGKTVKVGMVCIGDETTRVIPITL